VDDLGAEVRLPYPCVVVLVGPSGAGKSTWALANFRANQVLAADDLRALVGVDRDDQRAGTDAYAVLDDVLVRRSKRTLTTVVDTIGLDARRRRAYIDVAHAHGLPCHAVVFATPADVCRARNRDRSRPVPAAVLAQQLRNAATAGEAVAGEPFDGVHAPGPVTSVPAGLYEAPAACRRQREEPMAMRFGLQIPSFTWEGGAAEIADRLTGIATDAEAAGFTSLWVMDHFLQIPQVGREWQEMLDSYTALAYLAARTTRVRLGALVTGVTYRNIGHLAKIVATLDVLSGGRAVCGIGAAWFGREHAAYGWTFPALRDRYAQLEDALEALPVLWGKGAPAFTGRTVTMAETICYPRPLQDHVPVLVGGGGERRTLRLVAQHADACNLFGDPDTVRHKVDVLGRHCDDVGRPRAAVQVTHLSTVLGGSDRADVEARVEELRPSSTPADEYAARNNAGTVDELIGRFRLLADAGVQTAIVNMPDVATGGVARFASVIDAFATGAGPDRAW